MTTVLISGATGYVGRFVAEAFLANGDNVIAMGRTSPPEGFFSASVQWVPGTLDPDIDHVPFFAGVDVFVHCAFKHEPGRYRGGEGDDPEGFRRANVDGTLSLMQAAKTAGVRRAIFLSSRAVYGPKAPGTTLSETTPCSPDTLYGEVKHSVERALAAMESERFVPIILRATGVYGPAGPGKAHKWTDLFKDFAAGTPVTPRVGTEVHGDDLATAARLLATRSPERLLDAKTTGGALIFNVSDILLDRHDLLAAYARKLGITRPLPPHADARAFNSMDCERLRSLGWQPRGSLDLTGLT